MTLLLKNARYFDGEAIQKADILLRDGRIEDIGADLAPPQGVDVFDATGCLASPGFTDLHVHLREPGYTDKETIATGTAAAAAGGFTTVCAMPNLNPVPDDLQNLAPQLKAIEKDAKICVLPYAALTVGEKGVCPADIGPLAASVAGFSDDGFGVQSDEMMRRCMERVAAEGSFVAAHCEVEALLPPPGTGACVQEGSRFAKEHGYTGHSNASEYKEVERDILLAEQTGCRLHICHTSAAESFALVREAKQKGLPVSCEVTPHNLLLSCDDIPEDDGRFKMNPPLRTPADKDAALAALLDGTADAVATDHAPHTAAQKAGGFARALNGVVGLETAFPALYTGLVRTGKLPLETLLKLLTSGPRQVLGAEQNPIRAGAVADLTLLDLETERTVNPEHFATMGRSTPFAGWALRGWPVLTIAAGKEAFRR